MSTNNETIIPHDALMKINGLPAPDCLAYIEYWDDDGKVRTSQVIPGNGWAISTNDLGQNGKTEWNAVNENISVSFSIELEPVNSNTSSGLNPAKNAPAKNCSDEFIVRMPASELSEKGGCLVKTIQFMPGFVKGRENDGSEIILPVDNGILCRTKQKIRAKYLIPLFYPFTYPTLCNMPLFGIVHKNADAVAAIVEGGAFDATLLVMTSWEGVYSVDVVFSIRDFKDEKPVGEDMSIRYKLLKGEDASWEGIGRYYRQYNLNVRKLPALKDKMKNNPALEYAAKAVCLRCRMGVKQLPTPILEQTPENQPPLKVYMTFKDIRKIIDEFVKQGVGPTEICLVGWNYSGHDGAFPQLFPVEEKFGGMKELRKIVEYSHKQGYPLSLYDNYHDAYSLADTFNPEYIVLQHDGTRVKGPRYAGGQSYILCGRCAYEKYAVKSIKQTAALGIRGTYYIDEITGFAPRKCYDPRHPLSRRDNITWWKKIMKEAQGYFGSSHSEGGRDWAFPETDRVYCVSARPDTSAPYIDEHIPLYQIVYHGSVIYNTFRSAVNTFTGNNTYLLNISYGGMPIVYYHHIHNPAWSSTEGIAHDLTYGGPEKTMEDTALIKHMTDDILRISHLMTEFIEHYIRHSPELTETVFSNGESIYANFSDIPYEFYSDAVESTTSSAAASVAKTRKVSFKVPPHDFVVAKSGRCR